VLGYITHRLGLSPIIGYLLAGVLVGPQTPGFVADRHMAEQLAEVGVILLMFGVGLHFHLKDLMAVRKIAIAGALFQSAAATVLGAWAARAVGWDWPAGIVFGLALSVASTVVLIRVLSDHGQLQSPAGQIAVGWLVMEDIFTVFVLILLPVAFDSGATGTTGGLPAAFFFATLKLATFVALILLVGSRAIPWLLNKVVASQSRELFTLTVLALALGIATGATIVFNISMALGAFLAGMVVGQSEFSARAGSEALPLRDAFAVMFFLSVGMLLDPVGVLEAPALMVSTLGVVMLGKPVAALLIVAVLGYSSKIGISVAIALAQIGEFSFLLATLSRQLGVLPEAAMNALVATAIVSITFNPIIYKLAAPAERFLVLRPRLWRLLNRNAEHYGPAVRATDVDAAHRAVVVGYGPIGETLVNLLRDRGIEPTVVEMNIDTVRLLQRNGVRAIYGDIDQREVQIQAGVPDVASLILSASGSTAMVEAIRHARELNKDIHVIARADYLREARVLRQAGADDVFSGEGEVALAMTDSVLRELGGTPEQLDQFRDQLRRRLSQPAEPAH
jgi:CPA2 family monovalent cation:H+ antiporter-2